MVPFLPGHTPGSIAPEAGATNDAPPDAIRWAGAPEPRGSKALRSAGHLAIRHEGVRGRLLSIQGAGGQQAQLPSKTRTDPLNSRFQVGKAMGADTPEDFRLHQP